MVFDLYAIKDCKSGYLAPQCDSNKDLAVRNFAQAIASGSSIMGFAPEDFELYKIGTYDTDCGLVTSCTPEFITSALSLKEK